MHTTLCGAVQVTNRRRSSVESARPEGDSGTEMESSSLRLAVSKRKMRLAVAQAINRVLPSPDATKAMGER